MGKTIRKSVMVIFAFGLIWSLTKNIIDHRQKVKFYESYQTEFDRQKKKQQELKSQIAATKDYYTIEKNIREKLNLLKPDEIALILPPPTIYPTPTPEVIKPPYRQWLELFIQ